MLIRCQDGDLAIDKAGVTYRPWVLHGKAAAETWTWGEVRAVTVEDAGQRSDPSSLMFGVVGWFLRPKMAVVVVSLADEDRVFYTRERLPLLRAAVRRLVEDVPAAKVSVV